MSENKIETKRGKNSGYKSDKLWAKRNRKRIEAEERQHKYDMLSTKQKLDAIPEGTSKKQVAKLTARLKAEKEAKKAAKVKEKVVETAS